MTDLITFISSGKGTVAHVHKVIEGQPWEQIFILATEESKGEVPKNNAIHLVIFDPRRTLPELVADFKSALKDKVKMMESAVNIISGEGKEHMALLSALLQLGVGIRMVALTKDGVKEV